MKALPLVSRELSLASRRPATYWLRSGAAGAAAVLTVTMMFSYRQTPAQLGQQIFTILSSLAFGYALLAGVWCTADCLSEEKREGTLGLLFLTPLRGSDIVLGKIAVNSLSAAYTLVAVLPTLALPVLLGSVTGVEFWRMNLLLGNTLVFSLSIGLLVSAFGNNERAVAVLTVTMLFLFSAGLPLVWKAVTRFSNYRGWDMLLLFPSPGYGFRVVTDSSLRLASHEDRCCLLTVASLSVCALTVSSLALPRVFQEKRRHERGSRWVQILDQWRYPRKLLCRSGETRLREERPFLWLLGRDRLPVLWLRFLVLGMAAFALWIPSGFHPARTPATQIALFGCFGLHLWTKLLLASEASKRLSQDKHSGALELLLSTPLPISSIFRDNWRSLRRTYFLPICGLVLLNGVLLSSAPSNSHEALPIYFWGLVIAFFDIYALGWLGMLTALREPRLLRAALRAAGAVLIWPWVVFFFFMFSGPKQSSAVNSFFALWFIGSAVYDVLLARWAKRQLCDRFRRLAANDLRPVRLLNLGPLPEGSGVLVDVATGRPTGC